MPEYHVLVSLCDLVRPTGSAGEKFLGPHCRFPGSGFAQPPGRRVDSQRDDNVDVELEGAGIRTPDDWRRILGSGLLSSVRPEDIFVACRTLDRHTDERLVGELMAALAEIAARFLRQRVSTSHPNGGADIIHATLGKLQDAILMPEHPDAAGYSIGFFAKLDLRLMDQLRRSVKRSAQERPVEVDDEGDELELPDLAAATPEQAIALDELLYNMEPRKRKALALTMAGYPAYTDRPGGTCIASMLGVSRKTAETWVREMRKLVLERIKE